MTALIGLALAVAIGVGAGAVVRELRRLRQGGQQLALLALFGPSVARVQAEPKELVAWAETAGQARRLFPEAFLALDEAAGTRFPYSPRLVEGVHARWTSRWLAWEREHDATYKRYAAEIESQLAAVDAGRAPGLEARLSEIEQEKLQRYQERYEEYVRVGKAIGDLEEERPK